MMKTSNISNTTKYIFMIGGILLFILSIYMSLKASLLYENLTYVGTIKENHYLFILWGIALSIYYTIGYFLFVVINNCVNKKQILICISICILSILSFLSPYTLHSGDFFSQFHVYGSMLSCTFTFMLLIHTLLQIQFQDLDYFNKIKKIIVAVLCVSMIPLISIGDICTLSEIILLNGIIFIMNYSILIQK